MKGFNRWPKNRIQDSSIPYFQHERRCHEHHAIAVFEAYPMPFRNEQIRRAQVSVLCSILANISTGKELIIGNFSRLNAESWGYSRQVFENVLKHLEKVALISQLVENQESTRRLIIYSSRIRAYQPARTHFQPSGAIIINEGRSEVAKINTLERRSLKDFLKRYWGFLLRHEIRLNLDRQTFDLYDQYETEVLGKPNITMPDETKCLPYMVFNDKDLTKGGRFYGAFWISCRKDFRRSITIDGELTVDLDGKAMHTQLLYQSRGLSLPAGDPYLYTDGRRDITKHLMNLMLNTLNPESPVSGRKKVMTTYRKNYGKTENLETYIMALENHHSALLEDLYKPNWGHLQKTEAALMARIMARGMEDNIVILPVHDGCLCPKKNRDAVMGFFDLEGIIAAENLKHRKPLPLEEIQDALRAHRRLRQAA